MFNKEMGRRLSSMFLALAKINVIITGVVAEQAPPPPARPPTAPFTMGKLMPYKTYKAFERCNRLIFNIISKWES